MKLHFRVIEIVTELPLRRHRNATEKLWQLPLYSYDWTLGMFNDLYLPLALSKLAHFV